MTDKCSYPRCRHPEALTYLGKPLCADHWHILANTETAEAEDAFRAKIGLKPLGALTAQFVNEQSLATAAALAIGANDEK